MPDPLVIPLSPYHVARLGQLNAEVLSATTALEKANACTNEAVSAIVGVAHDVDQLAKEGWSVKRDGDTIVCTPPAPKPEG